MSIERPSDPYAGWGGSAIGGARDAQVEHETDPLDHADSFALLDDFEVLVVCPVCKREHCVCDYYGEAPEKFRNYKPAMTRRWRGE